MASQHQSIIKSALRPPRLASSSEDPVGHVLRRLVFGPTPEQRTRFGSASPAEVIQALLADGPIKVKTPQLNEKSDDEEAVEWWLDIMRRPEAGLHERMVWFWHGHLTSGLDKASPLEMVTQLGLLRRNAMGNFRTMLQEITVDPAMLYWLDGADSYAEAPNENYAREVMELFALGRHSGAYTEADVRAGAKALAGYWVDDENNSVVFEREDALSGSVEFLGGQVSRAADVIDAICDHPMCARFVAGSVHEYFFGTAPSEGRLDALARVFSDADLEIAPLVEAVVTDPAFLTHSMSRPRSGLEWFLAFERLVDTKVDIWTLELLGQIPLSPPNVAGWPDNERWLSSGSVMVKAETAIDYSWDSATLDSSDPVGDVISRAGLLSVSDSTRAVLEEARGKAQGRREEATLLHGVMAMSPEFALT